ncbi:hypothetical protein KKJ01_20905 [Xenorhabdus bovienii]|uniref:Uncharacterized protein n=1 Tax=Xenorhabdus bovienii TaxID=40576 RepID=A0AAJ1JBC7_XENBV|nr:hypothetical protein [Xenorhabdus bovienii]MDE1492838.1 hypothetical protein [Xenorhabdus bovienii]MDE9510456.1 hypothetical protein [Xenorhabdus bovienii]MDE9523945.1 hypothetical protein [Xenorhabdus bovienii]
MHNKAAFLQNLGLGDAKFVASRKRNANKAWAIWSDGAIELFGMGSPVTGLAIVTFPIELSSISYFISIAERLAADPSSENIVHTSIIIDGTLIRSGLRARCQRADGHPSTY